MLLSWNSFRALLPIGLYFDEIANLKDGRVVGNVDVLQLTEGGYGPANPEPWIAALNPQLILLSIDAGNRNRLPSHELLERLQGYSLLRRDQDGWVEITTDGQMMWVEVEKE